MQNHAPNSPTKSATYKKRTKPRSHQLWREWARERAKWPLRRRGRSTGPTRNARGYWAFESLADARETVRSAANGGANEPEIRRSLGCRAGCLLRGTSAVTRVPAFRIPRQRVCSRGRVLLPREQSDSVRRFEQAPCGAQVLKATCTSARCCHPFWPPLPPEGTDLDALGSHR
jgi:hypothetical protein